MGRGDDDPRRAADSLSAAVLLSNVRSVSRSDDLNQDAVAARENIQAKGANQEKAVQKLVTNQDTMLDLA